MLRQCFCRSDGCVQQRVENMGFLQRISDGGGHKDHHNGGENIQDPLCGFAEERRCTHAGQKAGDDARRKECNGDDDHGVILQGADKAGGQHQQNTASENAAKGDQSPSHARVGFLVRRLGLHYGLAGAARMMPKKEEEKQIIRQNITGEKIVVNPILSTEDILKAREIVREVYIDEKIERYIVDIVFATREPEAYGLDNLKPMINFGGSPRASINLALAARAYAFIHRRGYVIPEDVRAVCYDVLRHRIGLTYEAEANNITTEDVITEVLNAVQVP